MSDTSSSTPGVNLLDLMRHSDDIVAAFVELLLPCPFCGAKLSERETRGIGSNPWINCNCGASMSGGMLELITRWNKRDGKDFSLESEYAQRLVTSESKAAAFKQQAFREITQLRKHFEETLEAARKGASA